MSVALRLLVWAACLPLLWPPGVCPHHGPVALVTGEPVDPDDPCCAECHGADQSRLAEPAFALQLDLGPVVTLPPLPSHPCPVRRAAPPPHPSPPPRHCCTLNC